MTTFSEFLPLDRRAALAGDYPLPDRTSGAALFADISGFTPLTASLAETLGADRGAEVLTDRLNLVFGALIAQVHTYGGSVIGFSGDAVTCWFDGDNGRRATTAALAMQSVINDLDPGDTPDDQETSIGIKVAVAAGRARRFLVGSAAVSFVEVIAGDTLDRTAAGEKLAKQGEVVVSSEVRESLGQDLDVLSQTADAESLSFFVAGGLENAAEPTPWPDTAMLPADVTSQWILPQLFQRLELGEGQFVSELRQATAVFIQFSGIDYDKDDDAGQKLNDCITWIQSILERYGASLIQVTLGDKGGYLLMVFGAPVAHEDDTARALSAALEFRAPPAYLDFVTDIAIGVNRGLIHAGTYGGSGSLTYGILGDATNVAARLMGQAGPGQILLPSRLVSAAGRDFEFQQLGQLEMKGLLGPMSVASLECRRAADGDEVLSTAEVEGGIIGRSGEKAVVTECLKELAAGGSSILIFEGEAGIGKSYMIADLKTHARQAAFETLGGAGDAIEQSTPYYAWRRIIRSAFDIDMSIESSTERMNDHVVSQLQAIDPDLVRLAPLLNAILAVDFAENDLTLAMSGEVRAENLNRLLADVLSFGAESAPLVIVLDDAHWLDSASWSLARIVARDVAPLLLVIASRSSSRPMPDFDYLRGLGASRVLSLDLLSAPEILALSSSRLGVDHLPQPVANLIQDKAEGLPFFGEELAYALRDAGHIRVENGRAELLTSGEELERLTFPDTIQGVITSRIDRVTARQQLTLKVASVIGRIFAFQLLHDIYPVDSSEKALGSELVELEQLDITLLEKPDPELAYIFRHILMQEVTYGLLTFAQRKRLHRATAEWYETHRMAELETEYPLLAHHWTVAEVPEKSITYSLQAGKVALENGAFHEAIKLLSDGLDQNETAHVISDAAELAEWYYLKGEALRSVGQLESSVSCLTTALDLLGQPYPTGTVRFSASLLGQVGRQIMHRIAPAYFDGLARSQDHPLLVARIYEGLQAIVFYQNQAIAAVYCILRHLNLAEEAPPSPQRARSYAAMINAVGVAGLHKQADTYLALAQEAINKDALIRDQDIVYQYMAIYYAGAGRWEENEVYALQAAGLAEEIGNRRRWQENTSCLALALYSRGDMERSSRLREQVYASAVKENDRQIQAWGLVEFAEIALLHGELAKAAGFLEEAEALGDDLGLTEDIWLNGLMGVTLHRLGRSSEAQSAVDRAQAAISIATPSAFYLLEPLSGMAEVNMALWLDSPGNSELKKRAKQTVSLLKQFSRSFPISKPRSLLWEGVFTLYDGQRDKAVKTWLKGLDSARELGMPYDEGLLLLELGAHAEGEDSKGEQYIDGAREIFLGLDAAYELQRLSALSR